MIVIVGNLWNINILGKLFYDFSYVSESYFLIKRRRKKKYIFFLSLSSMDGQELRHKIQKFPTIKNVSYKSLEVFFWYYKKFLQIFN